jgi:hypothetical protein
MKRAIHRLDHSPDNAGHWQRSVALEVLLGKASAWLRKEPTNTFGKPIPHPCQYQSRLGSNGPGLGDVLNEHRHFGAVCAPEHSCQILGSANYPGTFRGAADRCWVYQESGPKRRRLSVNKGTREARLSRVVTTPSRFTDRPRHLPMRQPSGGAPVVVGDVNDDHMAKGCRMIRAGQPTCSLHSEASG